MNFRCTKFRAKRRLDVFSPVTQLNFFSELRPFYLFIYLLNVSKVSVFSSSLFFQPYVSLALRKESTNVFIDSDFFVYVRVAILNIFHYYYLKNAVYYQRH